MTGFQPMPAAPHLLAYMVFLQVPVLKLFSDQLGGGEQNRSTYAHCREGLIDGYF